MADSVNEWLASVADSDGLMVCVLWCQLNSSTVNVSVGTGVGTGVSQAQQQLQDILAKQMEQVG